MINPSASDISGVPPSVQKTLATRTAVYLTFALNYRLGGLKVTGYHALSLFLHALNAMLVYFLLALTFRTPALSLSALGPPALGPPALSPSGLKQHAGAISLFTALLFVSHPIQTSAVTYLSQRFTVVGAFFYLLCMVLYVKARLLDLDSLNSDSLNLDNLNLDSKATGKGVRVYVLYLLSFVSALIAMKSKENAFTLPVGLLLYEFMFFSGKIRKRALRLAPFVLTMAIIPLGLIGQRAASSGEAARLTWKGTVSSAEYLMTQFQVIVTYLRLLVLPVNQNVDYNYRVAQSFFDPTVVVSLLLLLSIIAFGFYVLKRSRSEAGLSGGLLISFGLFWFFLTISVESSVVPLLNLIFEHRLYLPSVGIFMAFVAGVFMLAGRLLSTEGARPSTVPVLLLSVVVLVFTVYSFQRNTVWQSPEALWRDVVQKSPQKVRGHVNLGLAYSALGKQDKAIASLRRAALINPALPEAHNGLGNAYNQKAMYDESEKYFVKALRLNPGYGEAHNGLGVSHFRRNQAAKAIRHFREAAKLEPYNSGPLSNLCEANRSMGYFKEAKKHCQKALSLRPDSHSAHNNLAAVFLSTGRYDQAMAHTLTALALKPGSATSLNNLGIAQSAKGMVDEAVQTLQAAIAAEPDYAVAHNSLALAYRKKNMPKKAIEHYRAALALRPGYSDAYVNLGVTLLETGQPTRAVETLLKALALSGPDPVIHYNLGNAYKAAGRRRAAVKHYRSALKLRPGFVEAYLNTGIIYLEAKQKDLAIAEFQKALDLAPDDPRTKRLMQHALRQE